LKNFEKKKFLKNKLRIPTNLGHATQLNKSVTSQKVITIGLPNAQKMADQAPSPNLSDARSKSIPIHKTHSVLKSVPEKEEKLDKLPPVPPSSWSNRRNQPQFASNTRLRNRSSNKTPTNEVQFTSESSDGHHHQQQQQRNPYYQSDLNIQESGLFLQLACCSLFNT